MVKSDNANATHKTCVIITLLHIFQMTLNVIVHSYNCECSIFSQMLFQLSALMRAFYAVTFTELLV